MPGISSRRPTYTVIWGALIEFGHVYIVEELLMRKREAHGEDTISIRGFGGRTLYKLMTFTTHASR